MATSSALTIHPKTAVRLSGTGGQGLLLAGRVLAEAAAIFDGLNVVQTNSYGPEARGGASRSEVVISPGIVDDLRCTKFDILICLSQKSCDAYFGSLRENGILIIDSTSVKVVPTSRAVEIPMTAMAVEQCHNVMVTNMISLGALCGSCDLVTLDALLAALASTLRPDLVEINAKALRMGYEAARTAIEALPESRRPSLEEPDFDEPTPPRRAPAKRAAAKRTAAGGKR